MKQINFLVVAVAQTQKRKVTQEKRTWQIPFWSPVRQAASAR